MVTRSTGLGSVIAMLRWPLGGHFVEAVQVLELNICKYLFAFVTTLGVKANQRETKPNKPEGKNFGQPAGGCIFSVFCLLSHMATVN